MDFEVIINDDFAAFYVDKTMSPVNNKKVLSIINDFENGSWRHPKFHQFIWDNISEAALTFSERNSLINSPSTSLVSSAQKLRLLEDDSDDPGKGSELAEILLYGIMKHHYKALPIVPKIFYKQNRNDYAKGADSVHIVVENDDEFSLWFGEAKFYNTIENVRLGKIVSSVGDTLTIDKLKKENSIITNVSDINHLDINDKLRQSIKDELNPRESIDPLKSKLNIAILMLYECPITISQTELDDDYKKRLIDYHKERSEAYFKKQIDSLSGIHKYKEIKFHVILFPVPVKKTIVDNFINTGKFHKNQGEPTK